MIFLFCSIFIEKRKIRWFDDIKLILQPFFISANIIFMNIFMNIFTNQVT